VRDALRDVLVEDGVKPEDVEDAVREVMRIVRSD
jgi:hypothetical protein